MKIALFKSVCFFLLFFSLQSIAQGQTPSPSTMLDSIISVTKTNSLYADKLDWEKLSLEMHAMVKEQDSLEAIIPPVEYMFKQLEDFHGALFLNMRRYNSYYKTEYHYPTDTKVLSKIRESNAIVESKMLKEKIAYLKIPTFNIFGREQIDESTRKLREHICKLKAQNPQGWIIDLRTNMGGNMYPMFAGLGELLPNIKLSGDTKDGANYQSEWYNEDGNFHMWNSPMTDVKLLCSEEGKNENEQVKMAVLAGRYTSSAGEAVASSLKGQKNMRLFGEITSGWSSTTGYFVIAENVFITPTVAWYMSLDKAVHKDGVHPDTLIVEEVNPDALTEGKAFEAALAWVLK